MSKFDDTQMISAILDRAEEIDLDMTARINSFMDLEYAHKHIPIDLSAFLKGRDQDFIHDFAGIRANMNRTTKKLDNHFVPRFTIKE